jgi:hypothetical protein
MHFAKYSWHWRVALPRNNRVVFAGLSLNLAMVRQCSITPSAARSNLQDSELLDNPGRSCQRTVRRRK